jgi:hypothetical protein
VLVAVSSAEALVGDSLEERGDGAGGTKAFSAIGAAGIIDEAPYILIGIESIISFGTVNRLIPRDSKSISPAAIRRRRSRRARY